MSTTTFTTRNEAIQREIVDPIEASGEVADAWAEFDIDAIADAVLGDHSEGYACLVDADEFWRIVERHAHPRVLVGGEAVDTSDAAAIAQVISREIPDADAPVHAEEIGARPGALETDWAVRVGDARLIIGPDHQYPDGICWVIYRTAADQDTGEIYAHGGWAVSDRDTARREIAEIIDTLTRLGTGGVTVATTHDRLVEICRDYIVDQAEHLVELARNNRIAPKDAQDLWTERVYYWAAEFLASAEGQEVTRSLAPEEWEAVRDAADAWQAEAMRPGGLLAELREQLHQAASGYSAPDYLEAIDTGDPSAVARHIYRAVEGARHPQVYYPDSATAPVVHAVHAGVALVVIGRDPGDLDRIAWALYRSIDHYRENDPVERGGWRYDDRDTARADTARIVAYLSEHSEEAAQHG